ncbi:hypothetical protein EDD86DRAFT_234297 [Gorgonomyces haynaldii]|nr:hypothetical protein EDD86DRAFT_234297 [Gorgonomyces haynaldii]
MVPFFFLVLVLPEVIPFLLMRGASIVPSTCITEEERDKVYRKLDSKRSQMAKELDECFDDSICTKQELLKPQKTLQISTLHRQYFELGLLSRSTLVDLSRVFGFSQYRTTRGLRKVLERHHEYLRVQDAHLSTELDSLSDQELIHACQERSIRTTDVPIDKLREELRDWIQTSLMEDPSVPFGLLIIRQLLKQSSSSL